MNTYTVVWVDLHGSGMPVYGTSRVEAPHAQSARDCVADRLPITFPNSGPFEVCGVFAGLVDEELSKSDFETRHLGSLPLAMGRR